MRYFNGKTVFVLASLVSISMSAVVARADEPVSPSPPLPLSSSETKRPEGMIFVPAGEFSMGTNATDNTDDNQGTNTPLNNNDARPEHRVTTKAFFLDQTEVTNAQYKRFCDATNYSPPPQWIGSKFPDGQDNFPVTRVNWFEARAFAMWGGKRLPTEAEWEHAARGTDGRTYAWGDRWDGEYVASELAPVGSKPAGASPFGALDMTGSVAEWTSDWFDGYPNSPTKQPDFGKRTLKIVRGGAWYDPQALGRTFYREVCRPSQRNMWVGFRCAQDVPNAK